jgi:hypothetical protein
MVILLSSPYFRESDWQSKSAGQKSRKIKNLQASINRSEPEIALISIC